VHPSERGAVLQSMRLLTGVALVFARVQAQCPCIGPLRSVLFGGRPCACPDPPPICSWDGDLLIDDPPYKASCPLMVATYGCDTPWSAVCPGLPFPASGFPTGDLTPLGAGCDAECPSYAVPFVNVSMGGFTDLSCDSPAAWQLTFSVQTNPAPMVCAPDGSGNGLIAHCNMTTRTYFQTDFPGDPTCASTTAVPQEYGYGDCVSNRRIYCGDDTLPATPPAPAYAGPVVSSEWYADASCSGTAIPQAEGVPTSTTPWPECFDLGNGISGTNYYCDETTRNYIRDVHFTASNCSGSFVTLTSAFGECVDIGGGAMKYYCFAPTNPASTSLGP